jgi:arylsulfatase A-like enzyme
MYEESMRVPMLVSAPGLIAPGSTLTRMVQNIDIAPTLLDLAGVEVPTAMDGASFLPLLRGEQVPWRDAVLYEYYWEWNYPQTPTMFGLRTDRYKYIYYHGVWGDDEFFDLQDDPLEKHNLVRSPEHQPRIADMRQRLFDSLEATGGMTVPLRAPLGFRAADHGPP